MIVVLGDIAVDVMSQLRTPLVRGSDAAAQVRLMPGGSGANVAVWLARLGLPVTLIARVGEDLLGRWLAQDLSAEGVQPALIADPVRNTAVIQVLVEPGGERTMVPDRGANAVWRADEISEQLIAGAELLHVVGYVLLDSDSQPGALEAMRLARAHGVPISLDPSSHAPLLGLGRATFWSMIGPLAVLLPNREEAAALSGARTPEEALPTLHAHAQLVAIKLDREGCLASDGKHLWRAPAPAARIVNATGAGDAFDAAFLARWLAGSDVGEACAAATSLGTHAATLPTTR